MKRLRIATALAAAVFLFFSCKSKNATGLFIPKDAAVVFHIKTSSLASKLSWDEIKNSAWFKDAYQKTKDSLTRKLMDNPESSGIDIQHDFAFFLQRRGRGGYNFFEGSVKDPAAFEALCKKIAKVDKTEKSGDWQFLSPDDHSLIAWNNRSFAVINDMPFPSFNPMTSRAGSNTRFTTDSLKVFLSEVMAGDGKASLFDDDRFASLTKEAGDMHVWVNAGSLYADAYGMLSMMKVGNLLSDNAAAYTINFDAGKISAKVKSYAGRELQEVMKKWNAKTVDAAVFNRLPSDSIIGVMAANVDPGALQEFFKAAGLDGLINMTLSKMDVTLDEILSATKGQFLLALSDLSMQNQTMKMPGENDTASYPFQAQRPDFTVLFATNVAQKPTFDRLLNTFTSQGAPPFPYKLTNDWFVAGNKPAAVDAFFADNHSKKPFADKISGHPFGMYIDFQRLLNTNFSQQGPGKNMLAASAAIWKDLVATGGEYKNGVSTGEMVITLVDPQTNSLKQLNQYLEKMYETSKQQKTAAAEEPLPSDTTVAAPSVTPPVK